MSTVVEPREADNRILEAAVAGKAEMIISGDRHLLNIRSFRGVPVVTPRQFLDLLRKTRG